MKASVTSLALALAAATLLLLLVYVPDVRADSDYYKVLGVDRSCSERCASHVHFILRVHERGALTGRCAAQGNQESVPQAVVAVPSG